MPNGRDNGGSKEPHWFRADQITGTGTPLSSSAAPANFRSCADSPSPDSAKYMTLGLDLFRQRHLNMCLALVVRWHQGKGQLSAVM